MNYLLIDAGNSRLKLSIIDVKTFSEVLFKQFSYTNLYEDLTNSLSDFDVSHVLISNVNNTMISHIISDACLCLWDLEPYIVVTEQNKYGINTLYTNARLLGSDRWLALIAAKPIIPKPVCVVDCGSAVTIDVLTEDATHIGGFITPGINMSRHSLGVNTSNLPFVSHNSIKDKQNSSFLAINTHDAIYAGTLFQLVSYIENIITEIKNEICNDIECIITGGDAIILQKLISHHLVYREKLVLDGLNIVAKDIFLKDLL